MDKYKQKETRTAINHNEAPPLDSLYDSHVVCEAEPFIQSTAIVSMKSCYQYYSVILTFGHEFLM